MVRVTWVYVLLVLTLLGASCSGDKARLPAAASEQTKKSEQKEPVKALSTPEQPGAGVNNSEAPKAPVAQETETRLLGQVSSQERILLAFKVPGNLRKVSVKPGAKVKKGQIVAELDVENYQLRAQAAKLRLEQATNAKGLAERNFKIEQDLREKDISSNVQFENAELTYKNAIANESLARVELRTAEKALADAYLRAPVDGVISRQFKYIGDSSTGGEEGGATFEMFGNADPDIYLNAPESLLAKLSVGAKLDVSFPAVDVTQAATIVRIVPIVRESDRTFLVVARMVEHNPRIVPGLFAEARVKFSAK
jgi:RND family efflux transporter MFP subunit